MRVLIIANLIAAGWIVLLKVEPLIAYCIVGVGAALYSPAKYGILPELARHDCLVKANSWIEGSTILAILTGMVVGAKVADYSTSWALLGTITLFLISAATTVLLPSNVSRKEVTGSKVMQFFQEVRSFLSLPRSRFAVLGASLFWAAAACVRVVIVAWAPLVLMSHNASDIANLTLFLALGIIAGSALVLIDSTGTSAPRPNSGLFHGAVDHGPGLYRRIWPARIVLF